LQNDPIFIFSIQMFDFYFIFYFIYFCNIMHEWGWNFFHKFYFCLLIFLMDDELMVLKVKKNFISNEIFIGLLWKYFYVNLLLVGCENMVNFMNVLLVWMRIFIPFWSNCAGIHIASSFIQLSRYPFNEQHSIFKHTIRLYSKKRQKTGSCHFTFSHIRFPVYFLRFTSRHVEISK